MSAAKQILFFITQIFCVVCFAQRKEIDSLKNVLFSLKDTSRIDCLNELSFQYTRLLIRDSAQYFESLAYKESEKINYVHGIAEAVSNESCIVEYFDNDFIKAEALAKESIVWFEKAANKTGIEKAYNYLWFAFFGESKYEEAYRLAEMQYKKSLTNNDSFKIYDALQSIGVIYFQEGSYDSAFYYYEKEGQIAIAQKNDALVSDYLIGLGTLYRAIGDYSNALKNYREVFQTDTRKTIQRRIDDSFETWTRMQFAELFSLQHQYDSAWHYYSLFDTTNITNKDLRVYLVSTGETYLLQQDYQKALQNFLRGLVMHKKLNDRNEIKRVLLDIAKTYLALHNYEPALHYAKEGLDLSLQTKSRQFVRDAYQIMYLVYDRLQKTDSAYFYYKKYVSTKDLVLNDQVKGMFAANKYQQEINQINNKNLINRQQLKIQQQQLNQQSLQKKILAGSIISLLLIGAIVFRAVILKRKNEKLILQNELQIQKLENEKTKSELQHQASELEMQALRSQMNPHFIFNCLSSINRFILKNKTEEASDYLTKFSRLIRMVLNNSKCAFISLEDELETLRLYLDMERLRFKESFDYSFTYTNSVETGNIFIPPLLLQPFAENAIWHGLMHKQEKGLLNLDFSTEENFLMCIITDNGVGREQAELLKSKSVEKQKSMGLKITTERLSLLNNNSDQQTFFTIEDLTDDDGIATGTRVHLKIFYKEMMEV